MRDDARLPDDDAVLVEFARRLEATVREIDIAARHAGDEFVIVLEGIADEPEAMAVANKVVASMRPAFDARGTSIKVTTSVGVSLFGGGLQDMPALLSRAIARSTKRSRWAAIRCASLRSEDRGGVRSGGHDLDQSRGRRAVRERDRSDGGLTTVHAVGLGVIARLVPSNSCAIAATPMLMTSASRPV